MNYVRPVLVGIAIASTTAFFLSFPGIEEFTQTCSESILCGKNIKNLVGFITKTDTAAVALGGYLQQKIISGTIVFVITLTLVLIAQGLKKKED